MKTKAFVSLLGLPYEGVLLKQLALLFDEIHYVPPKAYTFTFDALANKSIVHKTDKGKWLVTEEFNFFRDVDREWARVLSLPADQSLIETLDPFREAGIAFEVDDSSLIDGGGLKATFDEVRMALHGTCLGDKVLERLSETKASDYDITKRTTLVTFGGNAEDPEELQVPFIDPPNIVFDVDAIVRSCFISQTHSLSSIFHVRRHRLELEYLFSKYKSVRKKMGKDFPELENLLDDNLKFGEIAFNVLNSTVSSNALMQRSPYEILRLRSALNNARESFISKELVELTSVASDNPWDNATASKVNQFIKGRLRNGVTEYEKQSNEVWRKMFGNLSVSAAEAVKHALFRGGLATGASGILGVIAPGTSMWRMIALAAASGVLQEGPKIAKTLWDAAHDLKQNAGSSIAYVSTISRLR